MQRKQMSELEMVIIPYLMAEREMMFHNSPFTLSPGDNHTMAI